LNFERLLVRWSSSDRIIACVPVDGEPKPLLIVGTAHGKVADGSCIAILNPDQDLVDKLGGSWGAHPVIFRETVAKKCDLAISLWIDAYKVDGVGKGIIYIAQQPKPAKFLVHPHSVQ
jgi:hypothetical protein